MNRLAAVDEWMFLGVHVTLLSGAGDRVVVAEAVLPEGASPPLHVHEELDDSFYVIDGTMVLRCGDAVSLPTSGTWVPFPHGIPHTFRVLDRPARVLIVQAGESFLDLVRAAGHPVRDGVRTSAADDPSPAALERMMAEHGITNVGPPMEAGEAAALLGAMAGAVQ